jgi:hypothetical protein
MEIVGVEVFFTHPLRPQSVLVECAAWRDAKDGAPTGVVGTAQPAKQSKIHLDSKQKVK